jgi:hypothetical protein
MPRMADAYDPASGRIWSAGPDPPDVRVVDSKALAFRAGSKVDQVGPTKRDQTPQTLEKQHILLRTRSAIPASASGAGWRPHLAGVPTPFRSLFSVGLRHPS